MDEKKLIEKSLNGDTDSFSELVFRYEKKLVNYAYRMLQNANDAEDAAQEAFLRAYRRLASFKGESSFSTWLYTILNHVCLDMLRKKKSHGEHMQTGLYQNDDEEGEFELSIPDTAPGPHEQTQKKEAMKILEQAVSRLSHEHRAVFLMRDVEGMDYEEIARATNTTLGTVKSRINRARLALRKILEKDRELFL